MKIEGKKVLVTGGARGVGRSLVEGFVKEGAVVGVLEKDVSGCSLIRNKFGDRVLTWICDVSDPKEVHGALSLAEDAGFMPDILINNAGIIHSEPLVNIAKKDHRVHSRETWRKVMAADLDSVFYVTSQVVDGMLQRRFKGVVISISSISAKGNAGQSAYSAAKAAVNALTKTWSKELGIFGIRFAAIAPGFLDTPSTHASMSEHTLLRITQQIPLRKLGSSTAIYLAARGIVENDYINGSIIEVDGGLSI